AIASASTVAGQPDPAAIAAGPAVAAEALGARAGSGSADTAGPTGARVTEQQAALPAVPTLTAKAAHALHRAIGSPAGPTRSPG
ncbi:hypothetical protein, partial [Mycobacterium decipiens]|uniref:hypothetical protein n=1 Tax=Mycobacterium decipiens TaxID=1430326 RepID=UPI002418471E